ncbi:MAG: transcriptional repressor [Bacteroidales bacterium]|nr:transcriptional repressor [Bacteroidales bacterium]MDD3665005.1 transcriptional repressor [Bacteroidales bacterium]
MTDTKEIISKLTDKGLKITPQRIAVYEALVEFYHPTADDIYKKVLEKIPGLSYTTVYNILDTLVTNKLITRVKTDADVMRYDAITEHHHHLYCASSDRMEDYYDPELDQLLKEHFKRKQPCGFTITDIRLQLMGDFTKE